MNQPTLIIDTTTTSTIVVLNASDIVRQIFLDSIVPNSRIELTGPITIEGRNPSE
jgi:hypothetical protein